LNYWRRCDNNNGALSWTIGDLRRAASDRDLLCRVNGAWLLRFDWCYRTAWSRFGLRDADGGRERRRECRIGHISRGNLRVVRSDD
jgi:hypothetical protein